MKVTHRPVGKLAVAAGAAALVLVGQRANATGTGTAGDWSSYEHDTAHTNYTADPINGSALVPKWSTPAGYAGPIISNGMLLAYNSSAVTAFNLQTGAVIWNTPVPGAGFEAVANGLLVTTSYGFGSFKSLVVMNASTGAIQYSVPFGSNQNFPGEPELYTNPSGQLTAIDVDGGGQMASINVGPTSGSVNFTRGVGYGFGLSPTLAGNTAILATGGGANAVDLTSKALNQFYSSDYSTGSAYGSAYDASRGQVYFTSPGTTTTNALLAFAVNGYSQVTPVWSVPIAADNVDPALDASGNLWLADASTLTEYNPATGTVLRSLGGQDFVPGSAPVISGHYLFDDSGGETTIYDLNTLAVVGTLAPASGGENTDVRSSEAAGEGYFAAENPTADNGAGIIGVYAPVPEPAGLAAAALAGVAATARRRR